MNRRAFALRDFGVTSRGPGLGLELGRGWMIRLDSPFREDRPAYRNSKRVFPRG